MPVSGHVCMAGMGTGAAGAQASSAGGGKKAPARPPLLGRAVWDDAAAVVPAGDRSAAGEANEERVPAPEAAGPVRKPPE